MEIHSSMIGRTGTFELRYREADPYVDIGEADLHAVHGFCFYGDELVVVYADAKGYWGPPGGGIEPGETHDEATVREIREETNMKVLRKELIGYQDVYEPDRIVRQVRSFCEVEPLGDFIEDPDGDITEIRCIDPHEYKKYFDWGEVGDRVMQRALELKEVSGH